MTATVGTKTWTGVPPEKIKVLLSAGKEMVPFGIYALERDGHVRFVQEVANSKTHLKRMVRAFRAEGYKVHYNDRTDGK